MDSEESQKIGFELSSNELREEGHDCQEDRKQKVLKELHYYFKEDKWHPSKEAKILERLENHLQAACQGCDEILQTLEEIQKENFADHVRDDYLLREFIIERFYQNSLVASDALAPEYLNLNRVDPAVWCLAWVFLGAVWWFCCYWCLVWGIKNGEAMLIEWISDFGTAALQDIFIFIPFVVIIFKTADVIEIEPQMRHVYSIMKRIADSHSTNLGKTTEKVCSFETRNFRIIQHLSPACRAAQILMGQSSDGKVLPSAKYLILLEDADAFDMRERDIEYFKLTFFMMMVVPVLWVVTGFFFELFIEFFIPISWSGFTIANSILYAKYKEAFIAFYIILGLLLLYYFDIFICLWDYIYGCWRTCYISSERDEMMPDFNVTLEEFKPPPRVYEFKSDANSDLEYLEMINEYVNQVSGKLYLFR